MTQARASWDWNRFLREVAVPMAQDGRTAPPPIGKYRVVREIARGAMGIVYEAEDTELQRIVALKVIRDLGGITDTLRQRFRRESLSAARISHPNVVRVYDAGDDGGRMYLVMELVQGRPLSDMLGTRRYELRPMLFLLEKVARGVAAAHEAGIVHRDLKPANILVTDDGDPKVGDFGLAHWMDSDTALTKSGTPMGTPMYMAPEQVRGSPGDIRPATDVYALGAILYEILIGRPPHTGENTAEVYSKIVGDDPIAPKRLNTRTPGELETICLKSLEKDPLRRYSGAREFAEDLGRYLAGESILARPPGALSRSAKWVRRHRTVSATASAILIGLAAVATVLVLGERDRRRMVDDRVAAGRAQLEESGRAARELGRLTGLHQDLSARIDPAASEAEKRPLWELQKGIDVERKKAQDRLNAAIRSFTEALGIDPWNGAARKELADIYFAKFLKAEALRDREDMAAAETLARSFDSGGAFTADLDKQGRLSIDSNPAGAEMELLRYELGPDLRSVAVPDRILGQAPAVVDPLPKGSYLVILRKEGFRDVRYPVLIERGTAHAATVNLYRENEIGADFVYVPAGPFLTGGDPETLPKEEWRDATTGDFFISKFEVTWQDYLDWLRSLAGHGGVEEARRRSPRSLPTEGHLIKFTDDGKTLMVPPNYNPRWAIIGISWEDADGYCRWRERRARQAGERATWRLPGAGEWEKAARGADGRFFPWGDHFDWSFTLGTPSRKGDYMGSIGLFEKDESPYGVRDLGGGVSEWCGSWTTGKNVFRMHRGGGWNLSASISFRSADFGGATPTTVGGMLGFRTVKVPEREH